MSENAVIYLYICFVSSAERKRKWQEEHDSSGNAKPTKKHNTFPAFSSRSSRRRRLEEEEMKETCRRKKCGENKEPKIASAGVILYSIVNTDSFMESLCVKVIEFVFFFFIHVLYYVICHQPVLKWIGSLMSCISIGLERGVRLPVTSK